MCPFILSSRWIVPDPEADIDEASPRSMLMGLSSTRNVVLSNQSRRGEMWHEHPESISMSSKASCVARFAFTSVLKSFVDARKT